MKKSLALLIASLGFIGANAHAVSPDIFVTFTQVNGCAFDSVSYTHNVGNMTNAIHYSSIPISITCDVGVAYAIRSASAPGYATVNQNKLSFYTDAGYSTPFTTTVGFDGVGDGTARSMMVYFKATHGLDSTKGPSRSGAMAYSLDLTATY